MKKYVIHSAPMIYSPGVFRFALTVSERVQRVNLLEALGLPPEIAARIADHDPAATWEIDEEQETVTVSVN